MKKYFVSLIAVLLIAIAATMTHFAVSFLTSQEQTDDTKPVGTVKVIARAYYEDAFGVLHEATEATIQPGTTKQGIYFVDVTDSTALAFLENFRIYIDVYSDVDTYFRVQMYEQLTFTISNLDGGTTELAVLMEEPMDFYYAQIDLAEEDQTDWEYGLRSIDGYVYYKHPSQRISANTPQSIGLITSYYPDKFFSTRPIGYSLQIAIVVEAVQAIGGPENNWKMDTPPWGGTWS